MDSEQRALSVGGKGQLWPPVRSRSSWMERGNYSLCPADRDIPEGWVATGVDGVFQEHLDRVAAALGHRRQDHLKPESTLGSDRGLHPHRDARRRSARSDLGRHPRHRRRPPSGCCPAGSSTRRSRTAGDTSPSPTATWSRSSSSPSTIEVRRFAYAVVAGARPPLVHHHASFEVRPDGTLVWSADVLPDTAAGEVEIRMRYGAAEMKAAIEAGQPE